MTRRHLFDNRPVWAEISLSAIEHNFRAIRRHIGPERKILAVVKADAYGHGAARLSRTLARAGADMFGVTCWAEGAELRAAGIRKPILALTGFCPGEERRLLEHRLTPAITTLEQLRWLDRAAARGRGRVAIHLKLDTGMNRLGIPGGDIQKFLDAFSSCRHLVLTGTFTHFAAAEDFSSEQTAHQQREFAAALDTLRAAGCDPGIVHMANSAAIAARPDTWAEMVRPGALLYGYHQFYNPPARTPEIAAQMPLRPALSLRARVVSVKQVPAGAAVGYNAMFIPRKPARIAVLAAGYAEGLARALTNRGRVILHGRCAPLVGIISMDLSMADVTSLPDVRPGDVATFLGSADSASRTPATAAPVSAPCSQFASDVARELGTVTSDVLCAIGRRVPRFYV